MNLLSFIFLYVAVKYKLTVNYNAYKFESYKYSP